jgi:hypothetical protein
VYNVSRSGSSFASSAPSALRYKVTAMFPSMISFGSIGNSRVDFPPEFAIFAGTTVSVASSRRQFGYSYDATWYMAASYI